MFEGLNGVTKCYISSSKLTVLLLIKFCSITLSVQTDGEPVSVKYATSSTLIVVICPQLLVMVSLES